MHVLLVWNGPANEAERAILARREIILLRELEARGVETTVALCGDGGNLSADLERAGIDAHVLPVALPPSAITMFRVSEAASHLRALAAQTGPDLIEATEAMPAIAAALGHSRHESHTLVYRRQHGGGRKRLLFASRLAARLNGRTIVSCEAMRQRAAADDHSPLDAIEIATPGTAHPPDIDPAEIEAARQSLGIPREARVISVVSRFRREKGLDVLLGSLHRLAAARPVHVIIAGSGPEEQTLRQMAGMSNIPVHFIGHREDVALWLRAGDVVAIPSRRESFGRVVLEAMANGRPVVATTAGGLPEAVVEGETGLLVPPGDEAGLASALTSLLNDDERAQRFGHAARNRFLARYTIAHMAQSRQVAWERTLAAAGRL